jgi:hypothetical protein
MTFKMCFCVIDHVLSRDRDTQKKRERVYGETIESLPERLIVKFFCVKEKKKKKETTKIK